MNMTELLDEIHPGEILLEQIKGSDPLIPPRVLENPRGYTILGMSAISFHRRIYRKSQINWGPS